MFVAEIENLYKSLLFNFFTWHEDKLIIKWISSKSIHYRKYNRQRYYKTDGVPTAASPLGRYEWSNKVSYLYACVLRILLYYYYITIVLQVSKYGFACPHS